MVTIEQIGQIVANVLQLGSSLGVFSPDTPLLGSVPEFDSMAVVSVLTAIEDNYGIMIDDDEVSAEIFQTLGDLQIFVQQKLDA
jgi:acyl carrier protein